MKHLTILLLVPFGLNAQVTFQRDNIDHSIIRAYENGRIVTTYQQDNVDKRVTWVYDDKGNQIGSLQHDNVDKSVMYWNPTEKDEPTPELPVWDWWSVPDGSQKHIEEQPRPVDWWQMYLPKPEEEPAEDEEPETYEPPE